MAQNLESLIDFEMGKDYLGRDHDSFLKRFVEVDLQDYVSKLEEIMIKKDFNELKRCCDSLYSTSAYVGAIICQDLSKQIKDLAQKQEIIQLGNKILDLIIHAETLKQLVKEYLISKSIISIGDSTDKITSSSIEQSKFVKSSYRIKPPFKKLTEFNYIELDLDFDPFEEINKSWKCAIV